MFTMAATHPEVLEKRQKAEGSGTADSVTWDWQVIDEVAVEFSLSPVHLSPVQHSLSIKREPPSPSAKKCKKLKFEALDDVDPSPSCGDDASFQQVEVKEEPIDLELDSQGPTSCKRAASDSTVHSGDGASSMKETNSSGDYFREVLMSDGEKNRNESHLVISEVLSGEKAVQALLHGELKHDPVPVSESGKGGVSVHRKYVICVQQKSFTTNQKKGDVTGEGGSDSSLYSELKNDARSKAESMCAQADKETVVLELCDYEHFSKLRSEHVDARATSSKNVKSSCTGELESAEWVIASDCKSQDLIYSHCSCDISGSAQEVPAELRHVVILHFMNKCILTFVHDGRPFMSFHELRELGLLHLDRTQAQTIFTKKKEEMRDATEEEMQILHRLYPSIDEEPFSCTLLTPYALNFIYTESARCNNRLSPNLKPFINSLFYLQRYNHKCPWTLIVTPSADQNVLPALINLQDCCLTKKPVCKPRILSSKRKAGAKHSDVKNTLLSSSRKALVTVLEQFDLKGLVVPRCGCDVTTRDRLDSELPHQVASLTLLSCEIFCWIRPRAIFVSLQELKMRGLLPWSNHLVEAMLQEAKEGEDRTYLYMIEASFLKSFASNITGELNTCLINVKYLRSIYQCLTLLDSAWVCYSKAMFYINLWTHDCPAGVLSTSNAGQPGACSRTWTWNDLADSLDSSDSVSLTPTLTCSMKTKTKSSSLPAAQPEATAQTEAISHQSYLCCKKKMSVTEAVSRPRSKKTLVAVTESNTVTWERMDHTNMCSVAVVPDMTERSSAQADDSHMKQEGKDGSPRVFQLTDYPWACKCQSPPSPFEHISFFQCSVSPREYQIVKVHRNLGLAILLPGVLDLVVYTFQRHDSYYFSVGQLQSKGFFSSTLDLHKMPRVGPQHWFDKATVSELKLLKQLKVNLKTSLLAVCLISAELLCYLTPICGHKTKCLQQTDICLLQMAHNCPDAFSTAHKVVLAKPSHMIQKSWMQASLPPVSAGNMSSSNIAPPTEDQDDKDFGIAVRALQYYYITSAHQEPFELQQNEFLMWCPSTQDPFNLHDLIVHIAENCSQEKPVTQRLCRKNVSTQIVFEGKCAARKKDSITECPSHNISFAKAELREVDYQFLVSSLGDHASDYWIILTGEIKVSSGHCFFAMKLDNEIYIEWNHLALSVGKAEYFFQMGLLLNTHLFEPCGPLRIHLLKRYVSKNMLICASPWVSLRTLRAIYWYAFDRGDAAIYPMTFTNLKNLFVDQTPVESFNSFALIKK